MCTCLFDVVVAAVSLIIVNVCLIVCQAALNAQTEKLNECRAKLESLQENFQQRLGEKTKIESNAKVARARMEQATALIAGLSGERERWLADADRFTERKQKLTGDCAVAAAFLNYCGPFQQGSR